MKLTIRFLTIAFAMFMFLGALSVSTSAQTVTVRRVVRPVAVRSVYVSPWRYGYGRGYRYYDPFWRSFYQTPYERYQEQRFYLQRELNGNRRELEKHRAKYRADGYISPKEQRELEDDVRDVQRSIQKLNSFNRSY
jgi:hypothetical protein